MRQRTPGLDWLNQHDKEQRQWALSYLRTRGITNSSLSTHKFMLEQGVELERSADGRKILDLMKSAWRQKQYRAPTNGRQASTFTLQLSTKRTLTRLAKANEMPATSLLEILIENAASEAKVQKEWMKQQKARARIEQRTIKDMKDRQIKTAIHLESCLAFLPDWEAALERLNSTNEIEVRTAQLSLEEAMTAIKQGVSDALIATRPFPSGKRLLSNAQLHEPKAVPPIRQADLDRYQKKSRNTEPRPSVSITANPADDAPAALPRPSLIMSRRKTSSLRLPTLRTLHEDEPTGLIELELDD